MLTPEQIAEMDKITGLENAPKPVAANSQARLAELQALRKPKEPSFGGEIVRGVLRPLAKTAMSIQNAGEAIVGQPITEESTSDLGKYIAEDGKGTVTRVGAGFDATKGFTPENTKALKDAVGTGAELASNVIGGGAAGDIVETGVRQGIKRAAIAGAKEGAIVGGIQGTGSALQDNKGLGRVIGGGLLGAGTGAVVGGLTGVASGAATSAKNAIANRAENVANKELNKTLEIVRPELNSKERAAAVNSGRGTAKGILGKVEITPTNRELEIAATAQPYIKTKLSLTENVNTLRDEISSEAENLKSSIKKVDHSFDVSDFANRISNIEKPVLLASDTTLDNAYNLVTKKADQLVKNNPNTISGLLDARKQFDQFILKQFPDLYSNEKLTPMKSALKDIRSEFNNFIGENLPDDVGFRDSLKKQSLLYEAAENMSDKAGKTEVGTSRTERAIDRLKKNPAIVGITAAGTTYGALKAIGK